MPKIILAGEFLLRKKSICVFDVRTPAEFEKGHVPGAINLPLFSNEERIIIGTLYKQQGKEPAVEKGLEFVGPRLNEYLSQVKKAASDKTIFMYCWRGGMRSNSLGWLLETAGFSVHVLKGGYKFYRKEVHLTFEKKIALKILGGKTGSGKSYVLNTLSNNENAFIDLEKLACHKGSAFGHIGQTTPPTQEMFENLLCDELLSHAREKTIWLEDESRMIGAKVIPPALFQQMRTAPVIYLEVSFKKRLKHLVDGYGKYSINELIDATKKIERRLGTEQTKNAIAFINNGKLEEACSIILNYYDKAYDFGIGKRDPVTIKKLNVVDFHSVNMQNLLDL